MQLIRKIHYFNLNFTYKLHFNPCQKKDSRIHSCGIFPVKNQFSIDDSLLLVTITHIIVHRIECGTISIINSNTRAHD